MRRWSKYIFLALAAVMAIELGARLYRDVRTALASKPAAERSASTSAPR
ncbi:hypothetical protein L6R52_34725 [Myxococcota bacterium]|nr:hypothetical protein [Myxococcota bacterium]